MSAIALVLFLPFAGSALCLLCGMLPHFRLARWIALLIVVLEIALLIGLCPKAGFPDAVTHELGGWAEPLGIVLYLNGLVWLISLVGMLVALTALVFSFGEQGYHDDFYFFFLLLLSGMEGMILSGDIFNLFVFVEILSIATYILIAYTREDRTFFASLKYLVISSVGIGFYLLGVFILYRETGTLSFRLISMAIASGSVDSLSISLAAACLIVGVGVKAAVFPLHTWLPDAHGSAPHPVSAMLSGVMIKVSILVVWRIVRFLGATYLHDILLWAGVVSALVGVAMALAQNEVKKLLACHSISQMGIIVTAMATGTDLGFIASIFHIVSHSLFKSLLFLSVGAKIYITGQRQLGPTGYGKKMSPLLFTFFLVGALSISGLPPFNGFVSKGLVSQSVKDIPAAFWAVKLVSVGTVASMIKLSGFFTGHRSGAEWGSRQIPWNFILPLLLLTLLCLLTGVIPGDIQGLTSSIVGIDGLTTVRSYNGARVAESLITLLAGSLLYLTIRLRWTSNLLAHTRSRYVGLDGSLILLIASIIGITVFGWKAKGVWPW